MPLSAKREKSVLTFEECLEKARHFCAYQERSKKQVCQKILRLGAEIAWQDRILQTLEQEGFINEARFQEAYAKGKSRIKGWGPEKIKQKLALELGREPELKSEIKPEDKKQAEDKLRKALIKKMESLHKKQDPQWKAKLMRFCFSRGFDWETGNRLVLELEKDF